MLEPDLESLLTIIAFVGAAIAFGGSGYAVSWLLRPNNPNAEKAAPYECGEDQQGSAYATFNIRYYVIAFAFIIFDAEVLLFTPWLLGYHHAKGLQQGGYGTTTYITLAAESLLFIVPLLLALGLASRWQWLSWILPVPDKLRLPLLAPGNVPASAYAAFNRAQVREKVV